MIAGLPELCSKGIVSGFVCLVYRAIWTQTHIVEFDRNALTVSRAISLKAARVDRQRISAINSRCD
ncbi:MAG TPA: hypothetical protein VGO62_06800 [Myxococcota bacterium]